MSRWFILVAVIVLTVASTAVPALAAGNDIPTADDVLRQLTGGKAISSGDLGQSIIVKSMQLIRFLQAWAAPVTVILILVGGLLTALGLVFGSRELKRLGVGGILGAVFGYIVIRLAPLLVVALGRVGT